MPAPGEPSPDQPRVPWTRTVGLALLALLLSYGAPVGLYALGVIDRRVRIILGPGLLMFLLQLWSVGLPARVPRPPLARRIPLGLIWAGLMMVALLLLERL